MNALRNTRSGGRGRGVRTGLPIAASHASVRNPGRLHTLSPTYTGKLPPEPRAASYTSKQVGRDVANSDTGAHTMSNSSVGSTSDPRATQYRVNSQNPKILNIELPNTTPGATSPVGDNTASSGRSSLPIDHGNQENINQGFNMDPPPPAGSGELWRKAFEDLKHMATQTCRELKVIGTRLDKLDKIEVSTDTLSKQMSTVLQRTTTLEGRADNHDQSIKILQEEVSSLKATIAQQEEAISDLKNIKKEFIKINQDFTDTSQERVQEFNNLIGIQQKQVDAFHENNNHIQDRIQENVTEFVDDRMKKMETKINYNALKAQANQNKTNLIIIGLPEEDQPPFASAKELISSTMGIKNVHIDVAYRLGSPPPEGSNYARPILIRFPHIADRNKVWKRKSVITSEDGHTVIRIQQDLPKQLRQDLQLLHRVVRAASAFPKYKSARVQDYKLILNGKTYAPNQLEHLPKQIRPSTLSTKSSDSTLVFFSRHAVLSNHHPSPFLFQGTLYANIEHFLAHRRALLSENKELIDRALDAADPLEAKSILNILKHDHAHEWEDQVAGILKKGLREKFKQNPKLLQYLQDTRNLELGEASKDPKWGIGMSLDEAEVLDSSKWLSSGNLLGRTLSKIRHELIPEAEYVVPPVADSAPTTLAPSATKSNRESNALQPQNNANNDGSSDAHKTSGNQSPDYSSPSDNQERRHSGIGKDPPPTGEKRSTAEKEAGIQDHTSKSKAHDNPTVPPSVTGKTAADRGRKEGGPITGNKADKGVKTSTEKRNKEDPLQRKQDNKKPAADKAQSTTTKENNTLSTKPQKKNTEGKNSEEKGSGKVLPEKTSSQNRRK